MSVPVYGILCVSVLVWNPRHAGYPLWIAGWPQQTLIMAFEFRFGLAEPYARKYVRHRMFSAHDAFFGLFPCYAR